MSHMMEKRNDWEFLRTTHMIVFMEILTVIEWLFFNIHLLILSTFYKVIAFMVKISLRICTFPNVIV